MAVLSGVGLAWAGQIENNVTDEENYIRYSNLISDEDYSHFHFGSWFGSILHQGYLYLASHTVGSGVSLGSDNSRVVILNQVKY